MSLFDIVINLIESFTGVFFIYLVLQKNKKYLSLIIATIVGAMITTVHNYFALPEISLSVSWLIAGILYAHYLNRNELNKNIFLSLCVGILNYFSSTITMLVLSLFFTFPFYEGIAYICLTIVAKFINFILTIISAQYIHKYHFLKTRKLKYLLLSMIMMDVIYALIIDIIVARRIYNEATMSLLVSINILAILLSFTFLEAKKEQQDMLLLQKSKMQLENQQNINQINQKNINKMRQWKHDMIHIFNSINYQLDNNNVNKAKKVINQYSQDLDQKIISIQTGNQILDYILTQSNQSFLDHNINVIVNYIPCSCPIDDTDFFIIIGNLLNNAIENCKSLYQKEIRILITQKGSYFCVKIENSIEHSVLQDNPYLHTTKQTANHGIGIKNIQSVLKKYEGTINFEDDNSFFTVKIIIPIKT